MATTTPTSTTETTPSSESLIGTQAPAWAEYEVDPNKTASENAAAKTAHDATKPVEPAKTEPAKVEPLTVDAIKLPDGYELDAPVMDKFLGLLNDSALTPQQRAQALVDLQIEAAQQASERASSAQVELQTKWQDEVKADPEIGGAKLSATITAANTLLDRFGGPEVSKLVAESGLGNNVHFIRMLTKLAPLVTEGAPVSTSTPAANDRPTPDNLYPNQGKK